MDNTGDAELRQAVSPVARRTPGTAFRAMAADFWLQSFFLAAQRAPWLVRAGKWLFLWFALRFSRVIRSVTAENGRRILGESAGPAELRRYTWGVVGSFYDFIADVGESLCLSREQLLARIESVEGRDKYVAARAAGRGAILLTAHMGSFEVAMAALLERERRIHVVFKRDAGRFEQIRQGLRQRLKIIEQPVDDGWAVWMRLRDALRSDDVVAMQGDRVMPGQKGQRVKFLGGHVLLPTGPFKLAKATGAPIIPVFSVRTSQGRIRLMIEEAIEVGDDLDEALARMAAILERYVSAYPQQWLMLHRAFGEDAEPGTQGVEHG